MTNKQSVLVDLLVKKTNEGRIEWKGTLSENEFRVDFKRSSLSLAEIPGEEGENDYRVSIFNHEGSEVESFTDVDLYKISGATGLNKWYVKMGDLFENARRYAMGSDKILSEIIEELDDDIPF